MKMLKNALTGLVVTAIMLAVIFLSVTLGQLVGSYFGADLVLSRLIGLALATGSIIGALKGWVEK